MVPRLAVYGAASAALAGAVVGSALKTRANFFAAAVAVGRSNGSLLVLANFGLFVSICIGISFKTLFFGRLRPIEYEHLFERLWIFLTESLLALTIFKDDFSPAFGFMYCLLVFLKCFHWITSDRVDYMDQIPAPGPPRLFHIRVASILTLLTAIDLSLVIYTLDTISSNGVSSMVLFVTEFVILLASITAIGARYTVGLVDLRRARGREDAPAWEEKSMWLFYINLAQDFVKLVTYLAFFTVILLNYGLPLHILRDVYMTLRSFVTRCQDLVRYRRATRDMDALYPDATEADMARSGDRTCIICREEMVPRGSTGADPTNGSGADETAVPAPSTDSTPPGPATTEGGPNETPKKLACGHIFHFHCLRSWLERQQSCPTCRRDVLHAPRSTPQAQPPPAAPGQGIPPFHRPDFQAPPFQPQQPPFANPNGNGNGTAFPFPLDPGQERMDQFFRDAMDPRPPAAVGQAVPPLPQAQAQPRFPTQPTRNTPNVLADIFAPAGPGPGTNAATSAARVQTGIWGGPIVPGQFRPPALGAAPRSFTDQHHRFFTPNLGANTHSGPSGTAGPSVAPTNPPTTSQSQPQSQTQTQTQSQTQAQAQAQAHDPPLHHSSSAVNLPPPNFASIAQSGIPSRANWSPSTAVEGNGFVTPWSSRPPEIFTSTGTRRAPTGSTADNAASTAGATAAETTDIEPNIDPSSGPTPSMTVDSGTSLSASADASDDVRARRHAAEAAMRRMGIESTRRPMTRASSSQRSAAGVAPEGSSPLGNPSTVAPDKEVANDIDKVDAPSIDPNAQSATTDHPPIGDKGKGKSKAIDPSDHGHQADQPVRYTPFLTPAHAPLANADRPWLRASNNAQVDLDPEGSLDERIRALRQVDEVVWGLISDLTRLKSKWESEGGAGPC